MTSYDNEGIMKRKRYTFYLEEGPLLELRAWLDAKHFSVSEYLNLFIKSEVEEIKSGRKEVRDNLGTEEIEKIVKRVMAHVGNEIKKKKAKKESEKEKESEKKMVP